MKKINSIEEALLLFEKNTTKRWEALFAGDFKTYNKYLPTINKCIMYLYEHQQLHLLYKFLTHENYLVRSTTAYVLLPLYEKECIRVLSEIVNGDYGVQCMNAKRILMNWEKGDLIFHYLTDSGKMSIPNQEDLPYNRANNIKKKEKNDGFSPETLRLSQIFECPPTGDNDLRNEQAEFYVSFEPTKQEIEIRVNTFVNPYTQDVETTFQDRLERFKAFENVATIEANEPSKLGFMQIVLTIPKEKATNEVLTQLKDIIYSIYNEWKQNESLVWFKVNYHKGISYFEGSWWYPLRAIIKNRRGYERYDFSDELKFDEDMWDIVQGEYDEFENSDSFALIDGKDFQEMWETTELNYNPKPF
jgi:hypothetical protein